MRLPYFQKVDSVIEVQEPLPELREIILSRIQIGTLVFGFIALVLGIMPRIQQREWGMVVVFGLGYLWILLTTILPKLPYPIRSISLLVVISIIGMTTWLNDGLLGNGRLFILTLPILTGILFGIGGGVVMLVLSILGLGITGYFMSNGTLPDPNFQLSLVDIYSPHWLATSAVYSLISIVITISISALIEGFENSVGRQKRLFSILEIERSQQEYRVLLRTQTVNNRLSQLKTALDLSNVLTSYVNPDELITRGIELIQGRFNFYFTGIFLLDVSKSAAWLKAGSGEVGRKMVDRRFHVVVDEKSLIGWVCKHQQSRIILDNGLDKVSFDYPDLPLTRSEVGVPLIHGDQLLGAISIQSKLTSAFTQDDVIIYQCIANAFAIALENASMFQYLRQELEKSQILNRNYFVEAWKQVEQTGDVKPYTSQIQPQAASEKNSTANFSISLQDQVIGQFTLADENLSLSDEDEYFIEAVIFQAALALENVRLLEKNQFQAGYEHLLSEITRKVSSSMDMKDIMQTTVKELGQVLGASESIISLEIPDKAGEEKIVV